MLVVKDKYGKWATPCTNKDKTVTYWLSVGFVGNEPTIDSKGYINVLDMFMSAFTKKDKRDNSDQPTPKLMITKWEYSQKVEKVDNTKCVIDHDALPFY